MIRETGGIMKRISAIAALYITVAAIAIGAAASPVQAASTQVADPLEGLATAIDEAAGDMAEITNAAPMTESISTLAMAEDTSTRAAVSTLAANTAHEETHSAPV